VQKGHRLTTNHNSHILGYHSEEGESLNIAFNKPHHRGMQKEDGVKLFKDLRVIFFSCKGLSNNIYH
jgi:hypothetical protein